MDNLLVVAGVAQVIADYVIKFLAIGVLPSNRTPSSAMAHDAPHRGALQ